MQANVYDTLADEIVAIRLHEELGYLAVSSFAIDGNGIQLGVNINDRKLVWLFEESDNWQEFIPTPFCHKSSR